MRAIDALTQLLTEVNELRERVARLERLQSAQMPIGPLTSPGWTPASIFPPGTVIGQAQKAGA